MFDDVFPKSGAQDAFVHVSLKYTKLKRLAFQSTSILNPCFGEHCNQFKPQMSFLPISHLLTGPPNQRLTIPRIQLALEVPQISIGN